MVRSLLLVTSYTLLVTSDSVGFPYQSDFLSDRQNFFETPSTRTKTSSSEGRVEGSETSVECVWEDIRGGEWRVAGIIAGLNCLQAMENLPWQQQRRGFCPK